ncbi:hypothetical protein TrVGV298_009689 [Trichoderma virens]|nr:hypothetical protein TrVGV298_009689 [Trichoderma virens]
MAQLEGFQPLTLLRDATPSSLKSYMADLDIASFQDVLKRISTFLQELLSPTNIGTMQEASPYFAYAGGAIVALYLLYRWALPKPIPGIPYNPEAIRSLLGDVPSMVQHVGKTQEVHSWMSAQNVKLKSPIVQLFNRPFGRPCVVVTDFPEAQDILVRRTKEFDRSKFIADVSGGIVPESHFVMQTNDKFRKHRKWIQGIMATGFLQDIAAPFVHAAGLDLLQLWEEKARLSKGHAFAAANDVYCTTMDSIWPIVFGKDPANSNSKAQLRLYLTVKEVDVPSDPDAPITLPKAPHPDIMQSILNIMHSVEACIKSPVPALAHWMLRQTPTLKKSFRDKDELIQKEIRRAVDRAMAASKDGKEAQVQCAIDDIVIREFQLADKENRSPEFFSRGISDEILGFVVGAQDTTATSVTWALKYLADHQDVQTKLRNELRKAHSEAAADGRAPSAAEITTTIIHYRDAVVEEIFRCSLTEASSVRTAVVDTQVLGCFIPKGTEVFLMGNGPGFFSPEFEIDDSLRTKSSLESKDKVGSWEHSDMAIFNPDRWLVTNAAGQTEFDAAAGPMLTFGLGERGCYGRRMAYVQMKQLLTLIVWKFELHKCPEALSSYAATDKMAHMPQFCYIRPVKAKW